MSEDNEQRQWRSAQRYLADENLTARLQPTLVLAARTLGFPVGMVNVLGERIQHTIAMVGEGYPRSTPREETFCDVVVRTGQPLSVRDARADERFARLPLVEQGLVRAYVGVPLFGRESFPIGALCIVDPRLRILDADQLTRLEKFAKVVEDQLDLIRRLAEQRRVWDVATGDLAAAITRHEIVPWFQPIVDLSTHRVVAFEALARWEHPSGEVEDPNNFVPLAEDSDLIIDLDLAVMRQALAKLKHWQEFDPALRLSINMSSRHFDHPGWMAPILSATRAAGVSPTDVDLELTETARLSTGQSDGKFVQQLQEQGFRVWLDDFGTGWSSLEYLLRLPADGLKVDRAISLALGSRVGDALIRSVIDLSHELGMQTTIEGIESAEQVGLATALGCGHGQGYWWSTPVRAAEVDSLLGQLAARAAASAPPAAPIRATAGRHAGRKATTPGWSGGADLAGAVLDAIPDATAVLDGRGTIVAVNQSWRMFSVDNGGSETSTGVGVNYLNICQRAGERGSGDARQVAADIRAVLGGALVEAEWEYPCPSPAQRRWFLSRITPLTGPAPGVIASHVNITRRKMAEEELAHAASHDPLTGLANRTLLLSRLTKALALRPGSPARPADVGVLYIDLNSFKPINDTFGHHAGDEVLLTVAHRLSTLIRPGNVVARLGGDEFAVVSPRTSRAGLAALVSRIVGSLAEPHHVHGSLIVAGASVGTYLARVGEDATHVLGKADEAMYAAKPGRQLQR